MRAAVTIIGAAAIAAYAVVGMRLANDWAVVAATGVSLPETIERMAERRGSTPRA